MRVQLEMMVRDIGHRLYFEAVYPWPSAPTAGDQISWSNEWAMEAVKWTGFLADGSLHVMLEGIADPDAEASLLAAGWVRR